MARPDTPSPRAAASPPASVAAVPPTAGATAPPVCDATVPSPSDAAEPRSSDADAQLLRFIACGSVDDGKSTLIGRLLHDAGQLHEDLLAAAEADSRKWGTQGDAIDFALLVDGLQAEREQGITIDVAYRFFASARRRFIVADTPGHEQYTRNMVTGASTADCAVILVDARRGILPQTRRHSVLVELLGIRHVLVAVNKMDRVDFAQPVFDAIAYDYRRFAAGLGFDGVGFVPMSALAGDNVVLRSTRMPWWRGATLMQWLDSVPVDRDRMRRAPMRMPVQWVNRPDADFRGLAGTVVSGVLEPGQPVRVQPGGRTTRIARIVTRDGDLDRAVAGQAVTLVLADAVDASRGDVIAAADAPAEVSDRFECTIVWMDETPLLPGREYLMKLGPTTAIATVTAIRHEIEVGTLDARPARRLDLNAIAVCALAVDRPIAFDPYATNRETGGFILIDRTSLRTAGAGMIGRSLRHADIHPHAFQVDRALRASMKRQAPCLVWFTGLSGAGKSTIADLVERRLAALGRHTYLLDGDTVRHGLNRDLGFGPEDRVENVRRVAEVSRLMVDAGLIVLAAFISPYRAERELARSLVGAAAFVEVFVDTPLDVAEARDPKGLYRRARAGLLPQFTGIDAPYEPPLAPELRLDTTRMSADEAADRVVAAIEARAPRT